MKKEPKVPPKKKKRIIPLFIGIFFFLLGAVLIFTSYSNPTGYVVSTSTAKVAATTVFGLLAILVGIWLTLQEIKSF